MLVVLIVFHSGGTDTRWVSFTAASVTVTSTVMIRFLPTSVSSFRLTLTGFPLRFRTADGGIEGNVNCDYLCCMAPKISQRLWRLIMTRSGSGRSVQMVHFFRKEEPFFLE